ncbi:MAG: hypothetical protein RL346_1820 [Verrucomicrobiota bacterium]|jgi:uncharacterized protein (TIGR00255 family)
MTGFGRATYSTDHGLATVEASSVNRKQVELVINLPRDLQCLETRIRETILPEISRGRIQLSIRLDQPADLRSSALRVNQQLAQSLETAFQQLSGAIGREILPTAAEFLRQPGVFESDDPAETDPDSAWNAIRPALESAIAGLNEMRNLEGKHLREDCISRINSLKAHTGAIAEQATVRPQRQRELLEKRLLEMGLSLDSHDERLSKEIALFADRCDISEELTRIGSHDAKFREYLDSAEPTGRQLDFLCQELFREFNTIGSKAMDARIAQAVVEAKTEIEKIREQVQNIE